MNTISIVSATVAVLATVINLYFAYRNYKFAHRTDVLKRPVLDLKLEYLPPYKEQNQKTILRLKNVGASPTGRIPLVIVSCSWMPSVSYKMNFPTEAYRLDPNEEITWKFRIDETFTPNSIVAVKVIDTETQISWDLHEQIN